MQSPDGNPLTPRVLLVEDDEATRAGYEELLRANGFVVDAARSGAEAVRFAALHIPDVILTDVVLPDADGLALASQFREQPATARVPIIAVTAHWAADTRERARQAGVSAFLLKPSAPSHVLAEIYRALADALPAETRQGSANSIT